jgi:hypothetical protein
MAEEWAGNKRRQIAIVDHVMRRFRREHPIDIAGACETIIVNLVNDRAESLEHALAGVDAIASDLKDTLRKSRGN